MKTNLVLNLFLFSIVSCMGFSDFYSNLRLKKVRSSSLINTGCTVVGFNDKSQALIGCLAFQGRNSVAILKIANSDGRIHEIYRQHSDGNGFLVLGFSNEGKAIVTIDNSKPFIIGDGPPRFLEISFEYRAIEKVKKNITTADFRSSQRNFAMFSLANRPEFDTATTKAINNNGDVFILGENSNLEGPTSSEFYLYGSLKKVTLINSLISLNAEKERITKAFINNSNELLVEIINDKKSIGKTPFEIAEVARPPSISSSDSIVETRIEVIKL